MPEQLRSGLQTSFQAETKWFGNNVTIEMLSEWEFQKDIADGQIKFNLSTDF